MKLQLWSTVPMDLFFGFDSPFLGIFKVYWRLSLWLALPRDGVPNFFFLFLGGDASCSHAATSHFCWCFEFQEQRTGFKSQHLRKQPIGTKVSLVRKQTHEQKGKHNKTQVQPALPYNSTWCYTWYFQPFFFFCHGTGRTRKVRERSPGNWCQTRWGPKDLHFCSQVRLLKCLKLKE